MFSAIKIYPPVEDSFEYKTCKFHRDWRRISIDETVTRRQGSQVKRGRHYLTKPDLTRGRLNSISQCSLAEKQWLMYETIGLKDQGTPRQ